MIDGQRNRWIGVRESHVNGEVDNTIVDIDLKSGGAGRVLIGGSDFYAAPRLSPSGGAAGLVDVATSRHAVGCHRAVGR